MGTKLITKKLISKMTCKSQEWTLKVVRHRNLHYLPMGSTIVSLSILITLRGYNETKQIWLVPLLHGNKQKRQSEFGMLCQQAHLNTCTCPL